MLLSWYCSTTTRQHYYCATPICLGCMRACVWMEENESEISGKIARSGLGGGNSSLGGRGARPPISRSDQFPFANPRCTAASSRESNIRLGMCMYDIMYIRSKYAHKYASVLFAWEKVPAVSTVPRGAPIPWNSDRIQSRTHSLVLQQCSFLLLLRSSLLRRKIP